MKTKNTKKKGKRLPQTKSKVITKPSTYDRGDGLTIEENSDLIFDKEAVNLVIFGGFKI